MNPYYYCPDTRCPVCLLDEDKLLTCPQCGYDNLCPTCGCSSCAENMFAPRKIGAAQ